MANVVPDIVDYEVAKLIHKSALIFCFNITGTLNQEAIDRGHFAPNLASVGIGSRSSVVNQLEYFKLNCSYAVRSR